MAGSLERGEQVRRRRGRPPREWSIAAALDAVERDAQHRDKKLGKLTELWDALLPAELARQTKLAAYRGGTLAVVVESASVRFELDRLLRDGLEQRLRARFTGTLMRVKVSVGTFDEHAGSPQTRRAPRRQ